MYTKKVFGAIDMIKWTRIETYRFVLYSVLIVVAYHHFNLYWIELPWTPIALIGTAAAFVIGFQNNSAYDRIWEARKIWGGIVNTSRTFGMFVKDMVTNEHAKTAVSEAELHHEIKTLTYRHIAWMTALRHAMRQHKPWEHVMLEKTNKEWGDKTTPPERRIALEDDLRPYLSEEDLAYVMDKNNKQTAMLYLQSNHLRRLKDQGLIWEFAFLNLESVVEELFTLQGKSERIKNFPYPRHFASLNHYFIGIFTWLLPLGIIPQFAKIGMELQEQFPVFGHDFIWLGVPFCVIVSWIFHTMERIGRTGENPFEGTANDVPISTISRGIEIDLRQNLGEAKDSIPAQFEMFHNVQM